MQNVGRNLHSIAKLKLLPSSGREAAGERIMQEREEGGLKHMKE
jgi:hypothetical protein